MTRAGHVVAGDHLLRRDVERHRPQVDPDHPVDDRDQQDQAGPLLGDQAAEPEDHAALVLAQDPDRGAEEDQQEEGDDNDDADRYRHGLGPFLDGCRVSVGDRLDHQRQAVHRLDPDSIAWSDLGPRRRRGPARGRPRRRPDRSGPAARAPRPRADQLLRAGPHRLVAMGARAPCGRAKTTKPARITPATMISRRPAGRVRRRARRSRRRPEPRRRAARDRRSAACSLGDEQQHGHGQQGDGEFVHRTHYPPSGVAFDVGGQVRLVLVDARVGEDQLARAVVEGRGREGLGRSAELLRDLLVGVEVGGIGQRQLARNVSAESSESFESTPEEGDLARRASRPATGTRGTRAGTARTRTPIC